MTLDDARHLDKHVRVARPGEFFDQDADATESATPRPPTRAGPGVLYDQDSLVVPTPVDASTAARRRRSLDRQRERELEYRREIEFERARDDRRRRTREAQSSATADSKSALLPANTPAERHDQPPALDQSPPVRARRPSAAPDPRATAPPVPPTTAPPVPPVVPEPATPVPPVPPSAPVVPVSRPPAAPATPILAAGQGDSLVSPIPTAALDQLTVPAGSAGDISASSIPGSGPRIPEPPSTGRATAVLAAGTLASRLTGFVRVLTIGYVLGVTSLSDAYNYANGVPNIIYDLVLGGILSATLVPVFVEQLRGEDRSENMRALSAVVTAIVAALAAVTALLWLVAPWVIDFYLILNPAATGGAERALATRLLHFFAPQVFFLGAIVVSTALLNARRNFTAAAFSPVANNLIGIAALLATKAVASHILTSKTSSPASVLEGLGHDHRAIWILGIGTTAGYLVQLLIQLPAMRRVGFQLRPVWDLHHPAVRRVARLSTWLVGVVIANQLSLALVMILAGKVQGGVTAYQFSYQFFQLPYALIVVSVASALMPDLSERWSSGDRRGFERTFVAGLRVSLALIVPVGFVYVAIAQPFIQLAVHHGRVTESGADLVSSSLAIFAAGLPGFSAFFLLMRLYQAMQNTRIMFWIYVFENSLTVVFALIFDPILGVPGLALAWVAPYTVAAFVAAYDLRHRVGSLGGRHTIRALLRVVVASGITAAVVVAIGLPFPSDAGDPLLVARLIVQIGVGTVVYVALADFLGIKELRPVGRLARRMVGGR